MHHPPSKREAVSLLMNYAINYDNNNHYLATSARPCVCIPSDLCPLSTMTTTATSPLVGIPKIHRRLSSQHLRHRPRCARWSGRQFLSLLRLGRGPRL